MDTDSLFPKHISEKVFADSIKNSLAYRLCIKPNKKVFNDMVNMNKIPVANELYEVGWSIKVPFKSYWIVWLKGIKVFKIVCKYFDNDGYYFNRIGSNYRP